MALEKGIAELVKDFIATGRPSSRDKSIDDRRAGYLASVVLAGERETQVSVKDINLDGMTFRIFSPLDAADVLPTLIYYHGGCFISGEFATHDKQLRQLAFYSGCRVIAVQYRLAPEHRFPAAHDDAQNGAEIIWQHAAELGVDRQKITLAGDSAGGHLALVTALRLKAAHIWQPAQLILIYPMLDATAYFESYTSNGVDYVITRDTLLSGYEMYLGDTNPMHPEASPLWRDDFNGLPPVHILTAEFDPLCDEGEALFQRMTEQGVECSCQHHLGVIHGFFQLAGISQAARGVIRDVAGRLKLSPQEERKHGVRSGENALTPPEIAAHTLAKQGNALSIVAPVERQFAAYNAHDIDTFAACFSEDFTAWRMPATSPSTLGREALRAFYSQHRFNNPLLRAELLSRTVMGNKVFDHEKIYGIGEQVIENMAVYEIQDGLIKTAWFYFAE